MSEIAPPSLDVRTVRNLLASPVSDASRDLAALGVPGASPGGKVGADEALAAFQNVLVHEMVKAMRASVPESELFGKSTGEEMFEAFLDAEYSEALGRDMGSLGLTELLKEQLGLAEPARGEYALPPAMLARPIPSKGEGHS